jgi:uncharacterized protein YoxC
MIRLPARIVDSTTGAASATNTIDDTTASVKDDLATLASVVNQLLDAVKDLSRRVEGLS